MTRGEVWTIAGYLMGAVLWLLEARRRGTATEGMGWILLAALVGGVFGAKIVEWSLSRGAFWAAQPTAILDPRWGGRTILGGLMGGWLAVEWTKKRLGIRRSTGDYFALAVPGGEAIGRIGCYLTGCCFGTTCDLPWAIQQHGAWRHPAQLYLAIGAACNFGFFYWMRKRWPHEGDAWKAYLMLGGATRFILEFFRERTLLAGGLSLAQWACLGFVALGAWLWQRSHERGLSLQAV